MTSFTIETHGTSYHHAQAAMMSHLLQEAKFTPTDLENADFLIIHACPIKGITSSQLLERIKTLETQFPYKMLIISGCIPQLEPEKFKKYPLVGISQWHHIVEAVEERLANTFLKLRGIEETPPLSSQHFTGLEAFVPVQHCAVPCLEYMAAPLLTSLRFYPWEDIKKSVAQAAGKNVRIITLTGLDVYGYNSENHTLSQLLQELTAVPGDFQRKLESGQAEYLLRSKDFISTFSHPKFFHWLHFSLFSGSEKMLAKLDRPNHNAALLEFIQTLRTVIPDITISTDIVVGHPEETEEDHWESLQLLKRINPDTITLYQFAAVHHSAAAALPPLPEETIDQRLKTIYDMSQNMAKLQNERWLGWVGKVLVEKSGPQSIARNSGYKKVVLEGEYPPGIMIKVRISRVTSTELKGEVVSD